MILWPKNQQKNFLKKLSKNIPKIETIYLIRLVSGSLGKPMGWALMGWKNPIWKSNPIEPTPMGWEGTFVQNPTWWSPYECSFIWKKTKSSCSHEDLLIIDSIFFSSSIAFIASIASIVYDFSIFLTFFFSCSAFLVELIVFQTVSELGWP
jgi:hypothetical protein